MRMSNLSTSQVLLSSSDAMVPFIRAFQTFGGFTSGISIHYGESSIVNTVHQPCARNLIIGQRMLPQILLRAADSRPIELQDLLPADTRFKVLIFAGDTSQPSQRAILDALAADMGKPEGFLRKFGSEFTKLFDIISISSATKANVKYNELPELFRSHWSKFVLTLVFFCNPTLTFIDHHYSSQGFHR